MVALLALMDAYEAAVHADAGTLSRC